MFIENSNVHVIFLDEPVSDYHAFAEVNAETNNIEAIYKFATKYYDLHMEKHFYFYTKFQSDGIVKCVCVESDATFYSAFDNGVIFKEVDNDMTVDVHFDFVHQS